VKATVARGPGSEYLDRVPARQYEDDATTVPLDGGELQKLVDSTRNRPLRRTAEITGDNLDALRDDCRSEPVGEVVDVDAVEDVDDGIPITVVDDASS
jgi:hypothetical protein